MPTTIGELIEETCQKYKNSEFLEIRRRFRIERLTFSQVSNKSSKFANFLSEEGLTKGDVILIWAPNSPDWVITFFAALKLGLIVVPVDLKTTIETVEK